MNLRDSLRAGAAETVNRLARFACWIDDNTVFAVVLFIALFVIADVAFRLIALGLYGVHLGPLLSREVR